MVRFAILLLSSIFLFNSCSTPSSDKPDEIRDFDSLNLIPYPIKIESQEGYFTLSEDTYIYFDDKIEREGNYLVDLITESSTFQPKVNLLTKIEVSAIHLELTDMFPENLQHGEAYTLSIDENQILIQAISPPGLMRGIQTLRQIFVPAFSAKEPRKAWYLPALSIEDKPAFEHRGLLLDVCRHFFEKEVILKYIDALAYYKMNVLHFHLTEDQGWRIEIDKYPKLNEVSSWRIDEDGNKYGGYYTKEELKEIVKYAEERHITVIPEIELPGHAQAALAAYPEYSCRGENIDVANDWGVFNEIYCAGNDSTFKFIEDVLIEVMDIFPSQFIHIGGDEAPKTRWEQCVKCQKRMKDEGISDEHELQSYFIQRIENFLLEHDRQIIGWDEILEGGLSDNATVQSWRGMDGGIEAAELNHLVIMSPTSHCYLDYSLKSIDLEKIYSFNPVPEKLSNEFISNIIGAECNMWTEHVPDEDNLDSKVFPRMIALAEVLWSYPENPDFDNFYERLQQHYPVLANFGIKYGLEAIGANIDVEINNSTIEIILTKNLTELDLKYGWNDSMNLRTYETPIPLQESGVLYVQANKSGQEYGPVISQEFVHHKALNQKVDYKTNYNQWYTGNNEFHFVDGKVGTIDFRDGNWQGFWGNNIEFIVDLGESKEISTISANFYQYANSWIFAPKAIEIYFSNTDNIEHKMIWMPFADASYNEVDLSNKKSIHHKEFNGLVEKTNMRYIKFKAVNIGKVPQGHEASGQDAWIFMDEIIIE